MDLREIITDTLKTPWLAGTRIRSVKRTSLQRFSIICAIEELKTKKLPLKFLAILYLGLCRISNKIHEFLCEDLVKFTNQPHLGTPYKPRLSGIDIPNTKLVNSALRYSGARLSLMPITPLKQEGFRINHLNPENLNTNLVEDDLRDFNFTFISDDFLEASKQLEALPLDLVLNDPEEIKTPKISPKLFKDTLKSTSKKKKIFDDFTLLKNIKKPQSRIHKNLERPLELVQVPLGVTKRLKRIFGLKEDLRGEIELKLDLGEVQSEHQRLVENERIGGEEEDEARMDIEPMNLELQFDIEESLQIGIVSPIKTTQVLRFEESLNLFIKKNEGKCLFSEIVHSLDKLSTIRAFSSLLVLASTGAIYLFQPGPHRDITITCKDPTTLQSQLFLPQLKSQLPLSSYFFQ